VADEDEAILSVPSRRRREEVMTSGSLVVRPVDSVLDLDSFGRQSAQAAVGLTIGAVATLGVFFAVGEPWGTINDGLTIALAGATVPIAIGLARRNPSSVPLVVGAGIDIIGVAVTTAFTSLLIARRMTFEESLLGVLSGQALIGCWLILAGLAARSEPGSRRLSAFGVAGGAGLVATAVGIATGGMDSPLAFVGYVAGLAGTLGFYALLGRRGGR
jgi:hypothetical protein